MENKNQHLLSDNELESASGGVAVGDVVRVRNDKIKYCSNCARLL